MAAWFGMEDVAPSQSKKKLHKQIFEFALVSLA